VVRIVITTDTTISLYSINQLALTVYSLATKKVTEKRSVTMQATKTNER